MDTVAFVSLSTIPVPFVHTLVTSPKSFRNATQPSPSWTCSEKVKTTGNLTPFTTVPFLGSKEVITQEESTTHEQATIPTGNR